MGDFSEIDARHYFGQADFFKAELLLEELCLVLAHILEGSSEVVVDYVLLQYTNHML